MKLKSIIAGISATLLLTNINSNNLSYAATDWIINPHNNHSYKVINCGTWQDCENAAVAQGSHLVTINDQKEQQWLIQTFGREWYWIGLTDQEQEGEWKWISGEPLTYTNWTSGEPNNMWNNGENYTQMNWGDNGAWNDLGINSPEWNRVNKAIIEKSIDPESFKKQDSNAVCKNAINNAKIRLQKSANSTSIVSIREAAHGYTDAPVNRKRMIGFHLDYFKDKRPQVEVGMKNILNSPQLMKSISQNIISKCSSTGAVYFGSTFQAGCPVYVGLMRNGTIDFFKWIAPGELNREIKWGENYCT